MEREPPRSAPLSGCSSAARCAACLRYLLRRDSPPPGRARLPPGRQLDPPPVRAQPGARPRALLQPRRAGDRLHGAAVDGPPRSALPAAGRAWSSGPSSWASPSTSPASTPPGAWPGSWGSARGLAALAAVLTLATSWLVWSALSGMEIPLFVLLSLWGMILHLRERSGPRPGRRSRIAVLAVAVLARPEGLLLLLLALLDRLLVFGRRAMAPRESCSRGRRWPPAPSPAPSSSTPGRAAPSCPPPTRPRGAAGCAAWLPDFRYLPTCSASSSGPAVDDPPGRRGSGGPGRAAGHAPGPRAAAGPLALRAAARLLPAHPRAHQDARQLRPLLLPPLPRAYRPRRLGLEPAALPGVRLRSAGRASGCWGPLGAAVLLAPTLSPSSRGSGSTPRTSPTSRRATWPSPAGSPPASAPRGRRWRSTTSGPSSTCSPTG